MDTLTYHLLLADDDPDDCIFFKEALEDLPFQSTFSTVGNGVELMSLLNERENDLPDVLFLDLNMPLKNGFECLCEIKRNKNLIHLPVVIFSTSFDPGVITSLYEKGAGYYIRKPAEFGKLKTVIGKAITLASATGMKKVPRENFVISNE